MKQGGPLKRTGGLTRRTGIAVTGGPVRRVELPRGEGLKRGAPMKRATPIERGSAEPAARPRRKDTGPSGAVRKLVDVRSGGRCEWPACPRVGTDAHHRLNRKSGGRKGEMAELVNGAGWLLKCCRGHHQGVTSPVGAARVLALSMGWLLLEGQDAADIPVLTRHHPEPVLLDDRGNWHAVLCGSA